MTTRVPWWGVASSVAAPVLLAGGWTVADLVQPAGFDPTAQSISALAGYDARHRWVMTTGLLGTGIAHVTTALALSPVRAAGRAVLAAGGVATILVALNPLPGGGRDDLAHAVAATVAFVALAVWPALARAGTTAAPRAWSLRPRVRTGAAVVLLVLLGWYAQQLVGDGQRIGLAERVAALAQASWPLAVVLTVRRAHVVTSSAPRL